MSAAKTAEALALALLPKLVEAVPEIGDFLRRGTQGDTSPIAARVRGMLPEVGASEEALRRLQGG